MNDILYLDDALCKGSAHNSRAPSPEPPLTMAGAYLSRRFCIHPEIADLIAALAGLGPNRRAA